VGGHGVTGSADPLQVGVIPRYPGERADPLEREEANVTDVSAMTEDVIKLPTGSSEQASPRQPPTVSDTTAAAFPRSTLYYFTMRPDMPPPRKKIVTSHYGTQAPT